MICMGSWRINVSYGVIEDKALVLFGMKIHVSRMLSFFYIFAVTP